MSVVRFAGGLPQQLPEYQRQRRIQVPFGMPFVLRQGLAISFRTIREVNGETGKRCAVELHYLANGFSCSGGFFLDLDDPQAPIVLDAGLLLRVFAIETGVAGRPIGVHAELLQERQAPAIA